MINRPFELIDKADLLALIENQVGESRSLEYKRDRIGSSDGATKEFLADIVSLANAGGGDLVIGMDEERDERNDTTKIARNLCGIDLTGTNVSKEQGRLDGMVRDGILPRVSVQIRAIENERPVFIVRVARSYLGPHLVSFKNSNKFYSRSSEAKYLMDVSQIREAFLLSGSLVDRMRKFRDDRLSRLGNHIPTRLEPGPSIVLHILPTSMMDVSVQIDPRLARDKNILPIGGGASLRRCNLDGYFCANSETGIASDYVQFFRCGAIEAYHSLNAKETDHGVLCHFEAAEKWTLEKIASYIRDLQSLGVAPPFIVSLAGVKVNGCTLYHPLGVHGWDRGQFDRARVVLPEAWIDDTNLPLVEPLRATFDAFWQSAGYDCDPILDEIGRKLNWVQAVSGEK